MRWRRDVRRFKTDPIPDVVLDRLLRLADRAPSVGNSQPWRIVNVEDAACRSHVRASFEAENAKAAAAYPDETGKRYRGLKLAGFDNAPIHLAVFCDRESLQGHRLGRTTMPETLDYSVVCMITLLWLAARDEGIGLGWVSILDPAVVSLALHVPPAWHLVGYLLLGRPEEDHLDPELERAQWQDRTSFESRYFKVAASSGCLSAASKRLATGKKSIATTPLDRKAGRVLLVGAGPGDPMLLTRQAVAALAMADVVLIDDLVADAIRSFIPLGAEVIHVGKRGYRPSCKQPDINATMIEYARRGHCVVRLKSGDPLVFGRAGEEITACRKAGVEIEIVPGITSAQGAAARLGVSLTHRDHARRLQFITAHDRRGKLPPDIDWTSVADPAATTVVYMPKRTLPQLMAVALKHGLPSETAAVAVANATRPDEWVLRATAGSIAGLLGAAAIDGPVLVMIGNALSADALLPLDREEPALEVAADR